MVDNFNNRKVNKSLDLESAVLIGKKIDAKHSGSAQNAQQLIGLPKSSAEVTEELIDYFITHSYQKAASIIIKEARIVVGRLQPHNNNIIDVDQQLLSLEELLSDLIKSFCKQEDKDKLASQLIELKSTVQEMELEHIRKFLHNLLEIIENYNTSGSSKFFEKDSREIKNLWTTVESCFAGLKNLF